MTTKDQERKALAQIQKIINSLGENSYIGTAFEGCFEIAADNIENDFACSMKQRLDAAESRIITLDQDNEQLRRLLSARTEMLNKADEKHAAELQSMQNAMRDIQKKVLSPDDMSDCKALISDRYYETENMAKAAANDIVKYADAPGSTEFIDAVKTHRAMIDKLEYLEALHNRVSAIVDGAWEY